MPASDGFRIGIRAAGDGDGRRCAEIFLQGRRKAFSWQPADRFGLEDYYDCVRDEDVVVAEVDGTVVGFVSIDPSEGYIDALFIDDAWCNRGIGSALLREALHRLKGSAQLACAARNAAARAFYEHKGWVPVYPADPFAEPGPLVVYRMAEAG